MAKHLMCILTQNINWCTCALEGEKSVTNQQTDVRIILEIGEYLGQIQQ